MKCAFNPAKNKANIEKHGFSLDAFELLDFGGVQIEKDDRQEYGEERLRAYAYLSTRLCVAIFTMRGDVYRVISLRKANTKERNRYEKKQK
jgi:uncharacterized DUF497 family protein